MLRILIIDDHAEFRALLKHHIGVRWPAAAVIEHDPSTAGPLPADFQPADLDLVLLDYQLGDGDDGLSYLRRFRDIVGFPPVIMLTAAGNEDLAVQAIKSGATDYIPKQHMTHERLSAAIQAAIDRRSGAVPATATNAIARGVPPDMHVEGYSLLRLLGEGGSGTIYLARGKPKTPDVVIKIMRRSLGSGEDTAAAKRLRREYELIQKVDSPRVVKLHELGVTDGHVYLVMEYFSHGSLFQALKGPLEMPAAVGYAREIAAALEIIHRAGIVHRDLKPGNIMLRADGSLALIDFGTAKLEGQHATLTDAGCVIGTPHYMSPEQCGGLDLTAASDLYSLGVIFYQMLTGEVPYVAATPLAVMYKHQYAPLPQLPEALARAQPVLDMLLAKQPEARYPRARELVQHLDAL